MAEEGYTQDRLVDRIKEELDQASIGVLINIMELLHPGHTMEGIQEPVSRYRLVKKKTVAPLPLPTRSGRKWK